MKILESLFGSPVPTAVNLILLTLLLVGVLLVVFWIFRKFLGGPSIKAARGRQPRLAVTDAANLDDKRRLVLVRRDDVEHLVMIGGATDVLLEANIVRATPTRTAAPQAAFEPASDTPTSDTNGNGAEIAGIGTAAAISLSPEIGADNEAELESLLAPTSQGNADTIAEIKQAAMADIDTQVLPEALDEAPTAPTVDLLSEDLVADEPAILDADDAMIDLEEALGDELSQVTETQEVTPPSVEAPEAEVDGDEHEPTTTEPPKMEDEMQKLLDELSGEKA